MTDFSRRIPRIAENTFVAETTVILDAVTLGEGASVWYNSVLRADIEEIIIGEETNIQDNCVVHVENHLRTVVGRGVTVGHNVVLHACTVEDNCLIGMGSVLLDGSHIKKNSLVAAGSVVPPGRSYPEGSLILGSPAALVRKLSEEEIRRNEESARRYRRYWEAYVRHGLPRYVKK